MYIHIRRPEALWLAGYVVGKKQPGLKFSCTIGSIKNLWSEILISLLVIREIHMIVPG